LLWAKDKYRCFIKKRGAHVEPYCDTLRIKNYTEQTGLSPPKRMVHTLKKKIVQFLYLETCGVRKWWKEKKREAHGMRLDPALWHEILVKNTGPKYIGL
jgi:hypothetical protein